MDPTVAALGVVADRFAAAEVTLLAGSVLRGEGTDTSDLDLVVVYARLDHAHRESFVHGGWPVEAFVHDPETLEFFYERDRESGVPVLLDMVTSGVPLPRATPFSQRIQARADSVKRLGPLPWADTDVGRSRYAITALCDDLRDARSQDERIAIATALYSAAVDHFFRAQNRWSARGKNVVRSFKGAAPELAAEFHAAFRDLFEHADADSVPAVCEKLLRPYGGRLFDGYKIDAAHDWRKTSQ